MVERAVLLMLSDEVVVCLGVLLDDVGCYETLETLVSHVWDLRRKWERGEICV